MNTSVIATITQLPAQAAPTTDREHLIAEFAYATTEQDRARIEQRLWEGTTPEERKGKFKRDFITRLLKVRPTDVEGRNMLLIAGTAANPLWERVENGSLALRAAGRLTTDARWLARERGLTLAHAVLQALVLHDAAPANGRGKRRLVRPLRSADAGRFTGKHRSTPKKTPLAEAGRFWASLRDQISEFMRSRIEETDVDSIVLDRLVGEFMKDLRVLTDTWSGKINRATNSESAASVTRRAVVIAACRTLSIDPPKPGKKADLVLANTRKKALARAYHPDGGGSTATTEQYQAVLEAYATLESYNEGLGR